MRHVFQSDEPLASPGQIQLPTAKAALYSVGFVCAQLQIHPALVAQAAIALELQPTAIDNIPYFDAADFDRMIAWMKQQAAEAAKTDEGTDE